jgi:hypothetical protein
MTNQVTFFSDQDAAASSTEKHWHGGRGIFSAEAGTWGGATVKLQYRGPNGTWIDATGIVLSANGALPFEASNGAALQSVVTGTPTNLYCTAAGVGARG